MGQSTQVLSCCCPIQPTLNASIIVEPSRLQELLSVLEEFEERTTSNCGEIIAKDLLTTWQICVSDAWGELGNKDLQIMKETVAAYIESMNLGKNVSVTITDFLSFADGHVDRLPSMGGAAVHELQLAVSEDPRSLHVFLNEFCARHGMDGASATQDDLILCLSELFALYGSAPDMPSNVAASLQQGPHDISETLDLWDAVARLLGRRRTPVELLLYDVSHGASRIFTPLLLGRSFEAIYHSSVLAFDLEFWYGGHIFSNEPPIDAWVFGPPLSDSLEQLQPSAYGVGLRSVHLGNTLATVHELRGFLREMKARYRPDNYDVLTHNCNCFSDEVVRFLTGGNIPEAVRKLPELLMSTPTAQLLRPFLNRWLRGFHSREEEDVEPPIKTTLSSQSTEVPLAEDTSEDEAEFRRWDEGIMDGNDVDLGYFDPSAVENFQRSPCKRESVMRSPSGQLVSAKSGDPLPSRMNEPKEFRRQVRREAIKRITNGQLVHAKML